MVSLMTLAVGIASRGSLWMVADRRLSCGSQVVRDDAKKVLKICATDGSALVSYAGLGSTATGMEPSQWMSNTLRGRRLTMHESMSVLANATQDQIPDYLKPFPDFSLNHQLVAVAFVNDRHAIYEVILTPTGVNANRKEFPEDQTVALAVGSGRASIDKAHADHVTSLVHTLDEKASSREAVAVELARLAHEAHLTTSDGTVGPSCIVSYHLQGGTAAQLAFTEGRRDRDDPPIPTISHGTDMIALLGTLLRHTRFTRNPATRRLEVEGDPDDKVNASLAKLPKHPDWKLR